MNFNKRVEDTTKIFDARWKANHNDDVQRLRERDRIRTNKVFSSDPYEYEREEDFLPNNSSNQVKSNREIGLERLEQNLNRLRQNRGKL